MGEDPRVVEGLRRQRELLERMRSEGAQHLGWKAGFGSPAALSALALDAPLVGFLTDRTLLAPGPDGDATAGLDGWARPMAEAEVAVVLGADLPAAASEAECLAAVRSVAPAIELADLDLVPGPEQVTAILEGDIFHRGVVLGDARETPSGWPGASLRATVRHTPRDGEGTVTALEDVELVPGSAGAVLRACARAAADLGPGLRAGDVVILGSMVPPVPVAPGDRFEVELAGLRPVAVRTA